MKLEQYLLVIEKWLQDKLMETRMDGYVLGISGGIDSALVAILAHRAVGNKLFCVIMPCESDEQDAIDGRKLLDKFAIPYTEVNLTDTYRQMVIDIEKKASGQVVTLDHLAHINTKVRLRMVTLYAIGQARRSLVLGTDNWDENYTGYFTKYGDGGVDLLPIVHLTKGEVFAASRLLGVPESILNRVPSAGLYAEQTDEDEMGISYAELDAYLLGKKIDDTKVKRIEHLHKVSAHKRDPIAAPREYEREEE